MSVLNNYFYATFLRHSCSRHNHSASDEGVQTLPVCQSSIYHWLDYLFFVCRINTHFCDVLFCHITCSKIVLCMMRQCVQ